MPLAALHSPWAASLLVDGGPYWVMARHTHIPTMAKSRPVEICFVDVEVLHSGDSFIVMLLQRPVHLST